MKKFTAILMVVITIIMTGCSANKAAKEMVIKGIIPERQIESYGYKPDETDIAHGEDGDYPVYRLTEIVIWNDEWADDKKQEILYENYFCFDTFDTAWYCSDTYEIWLRRDKGGNYAWWRIDPLHICYHGLFNEEMGDGITPFPFS